ncbi:MKRN2 opposite strand protein isoform X2 [Mastacembelus armatus]|uniref:MKRN2 opposite strand protein isoform X2 n=1 Tax=Mastacembelus armatus TaxID=205130 RepID=UPI000E45DB31|nr:MKRN2 opposite strand protein isoform X2 [Mastacembelus armatus]
MENTVIRLSHCQKEIFCFSVPDECPSCGKELRGSRLQEAPVSLPSPFNNGHKSSCCLLVAPAHNNLDREFDGTSDLHTGISNTKGVVYNYTRSGVCRDQSGWECCVSVPLVRPDTFHLLAQWDQYLDRFSDGPMWDPAWHSGGAGLSKQRHVHSYLHLAKDEEGLKVHHTIPAHPEIPLLHGGPAGGPPRGPTFHQLNQ